jgi:hypothetical protein
MKPWTFLRIASVVTLVFAAGHTNGARKSWSPIGDTDVLLSMKSFRFDMMGVTRSCWDFYYGFGLFISLYLALQAVLLWQLAAVAKRDPAAARPMIVSFLIAAVGSTVLAWVYIFAMPAVFTAVIAACLGAALLVPSRRGAAS